MTTANRPLIAIAASTILVELFMLITDMGPQLILVTAVCGLVGVVVWLIVSLGHAAIRTELTSEPHPLPPSKVPDLRITLLRQGLSYGRHDNQIPDRMYVSLIDLIDDELLVSHGIDRRADPEAARSVIGDELMRFADEPERSRSLGLEGLARVVTQIERIRPESTV